MLNGKIRLIAFLIFSVFCFSLFCVICCAETSESVPTMTREYLQPSTEIVRTYNARTVFFIVIGFMAAAIIIPIAFRITDEIKKSVSKKPIKKKTTKKKK